ncbi:MAG: ribulose-phosphate 3-epimerase [Bacteriovoracaceae bacterium]|jgi:ribulose-phosphate 3-epimerase
MKTIIAPSLLACDFLNIESELKHFEGQDNFWFHLDIMDGHFVPNLTFGHPIISLIKKKTTVPLDAHLMVSNPEFYIDTFADLGIHNLTWHFEASKEGTLALIQKAKKSFASVGISIKPKTEIESIPLEILRNIDLLLIMSVEPGFGGQKFIEDTYDRIKFFKDLREKHSLNFQIQIDGGVKDSNAKKLLETGADNLVAGSYVFSANEGEYINKVNSLRL